MNRKCADARPGIAPNRASDRPQQSTRQVLFCIGNTFLSPDRNDRPYSNDNRRFGHMLFFANMPLGFRNTVGDKPAEDRLKPAY